MGNPFRETWDGGLGGAPSATHVADRPHAKCAGHFSNAAAIVARNAGWRDHPLVPSWVDLSDVGLDSYFTRSAIAEKCYARLLAAMRGDGADPDAYRFVEPAAGTGAFYDLLPRARRIGLDIVQYRDDYCREDFLSWTPPQDSRGYAVVGNPPFGYRGWLALAFMNHAAQFADYVGMILPMSFQSDGKGSPKLRVRGLRLIETKHLTPDAFVDTHGRLVRVNALWQVWQRGVNNSRRLPTCDAWLDLFTVDMRQERLCGQSRLHEADYFLQRTFFGKPPQLVEQFEQVRYVCGYGLVIKKDPTAVVDALNATDWCEYSNLAAHSARHISMYHIRRALTDAGFVDDV